MGKILGICINCKHIRDCHFLKSNLRNSTSIWDCNEHQTGSSPNNLPPKLLAGCAKDVPAIDQFKLCGNCANLSMCTFPGRSTPLQFCEEYY
jgi:hypothetical protein